MTGSIVGAWNQSYHFVRDKIPGPWDPTVNKSIGGKPLAIGTHRSARGRRKHLPLKHPPLGEPRGIEPEVECDGTGKGNLADQREITRVDP